MRTRVVLAWLVAALVCAGVVAVSVIPPVPGAPSSRLVGAALLATCWALTGALLITARPGNAVGWLVLLCGVLQGWSSLGTAYGGYGVAVAHPMWPGADWVALSASMIYLPSLLLPLTVIVAVYPDGRLASPRWRVPVIALAAGLTVITVAASLTAGAYDDLAPGPPPVVLPGGVWMSVLFGACAALILGGTLAIWVMTGLRLARATSPLRGQLAWYVATVLPGFLLILMAALPQWLTLLGGLSIPLAIAVGVLRYRMLDIVLRPVIVYGCLTVVVGAVFVGVSALAGSAMVRGPLPGVIAAGLVAVGLTPARDRLQRGADRFVYGERRDPIRAVVSLGDRTESADPESLLGVVLASVADSVRAPGASVTGPSGQLLAAHGQVDEHPAVTLPLVVAGHPVGTLRVSVRVAGSAYSAADGRVLGVLAPQVAVVVHALDLAGALEAQRDRVVVATRSERDRLRRELHDGLGPTLAGTALGLRAARDALAADDHDTVGRLLDRIGVEVELAVADVRRVIDDLRPADLDDGSLDLAVRRRAASIAPAVDVDVEVGALPDLRPEVETAAYRITSEALTNVARHAGAHQVQVAVAAADGALTVRVADDGTGIPDTAPTGVGLESMRRRAHGLGGTFKVDSNQDGTVVTARLPL
ncbi:MAG: sensor histidine kinase [Candidatus Nanopelagicales bacterium]